REIALEQTGYREGGVRGNELIGPLLHVAAVDDRADDRRVGAGSADPLTLERLDQRRFREPGGRLRLVSDRLDRSGLDLVTLAQARERLLAVFERRVRIVGSLDIGAEEAGKVD